MVVRAGRSPGPPAVALVTFLLLAALFLPSGWAGPGFALLVGATPAALLLLATRGGTGRGSAGRGSAGGWPAGGWPAGGWLIASAAVALGLVGAGFLLLVARRDADPVEPWLWGLPSSMGVQVWVLAVIPLLLLGGLYGLGFARWRPAPDELERLKALARDDATDESEPDE